MRLGPNKARFFGFFQPAGDGMKLSGKQINSGQNFRIMLYYVSSRIILTLSLILWVCLTENPKIVSLKYPVVGIILCLSLITLKSVISGWRTCNKYSIIGSLRTVSQIISYESVLYLVLFNLIIFYQKIEINQWIRLILISAPLLILIWIPSCLADLNRNPYDFSEGERELVRGYNTEFGSSGFTLIFLSEYMNIIFISIITNTFFLTTEILILLTIMIIIIIILWTRAILPRQRFDNLIILAWKFLIPTITIIILTSWIEIN